MSDLKPFIDKLEKLERKIEILISLNNQTQSGYLDRVACNERDTLRRLFDLSARLTSLETRLSPISEQSLKLMALTMRRRKRRAR